jgi:hypothetical protein
LIEVRENSWNPVLEKENLCWHRFWPRKWSILVSNVPFDERSSH